jgi:uracil-DNA glycosylase family 4
MNEPLFPTALEFVVDVLSARSRAGLLGSAPAEALYGLTRESPASPVQVGRAGEQRSSVREVLISRVEERNVGGASATAAGLVAGADAVQLSASPLLQPPPSLVGDEGTVAQRMEGLRAIANGCKQCPELATARAQVVFGQGRVDAELMIIGEAPGVEEDREGRPFAGEAGELLEKMLKAMGLSMGAVYATSVLKCHPFVVGEPDAVRPPNAGELERCLPYLAAQIALVRPRVIVAMGAGAMHAVFGGKTPMGTLRSRWHEVQGIPVMPTFHPRYLLRNDDIRERRKVWEDLMQVMERLGIEVTARHRAFFLKTS